ncbi:oligopeptide/dipeptide ABC transporter ATP-binding protein [Streptomyces jeddahensis]|uniref:oligopeptide/dipeptide ABC transporter ATP-binding protein n=1 Tax=Streptomyces jeddahensis TaxID=1716141 RepID=UPI0038CD718C
MLEDGPAQTVARHPRHPHTQALVAASPELDRLAKPDQLRPARDPRPEPPRGGGCPFAPMCGFAEDRCWVEQPPVHLAADDGHVACHRYDAAADTTAGVLVPHL